MNRRPNGHRYTESTASIVAAANQTLEGVPLRPGATRSTSDSVLDSATGQSRRRTANVNRRSGGVFMYGSGNPVPGMLDHRATWGGNEHDDRHAWEQGYTFVGPSAAESSAQGRAGNRSSRFFDHPQRGATLSTSGSTLVGSTTGARELADAPMTDGSTGRSAQLHSPTANPIAPPLGHGIVFTIESFMDDTTESARTSVDASASSSPVQPTTPSEYQLPALGTFGAIDPLKGELFGSQDGWEATPEGGTTASPTASPPASTTPTPTATTFAESHHRQLTNELRRLGPSVQCEVAQSVVNANAHTRAMLERNQEMLVLLSRLRKSYGGPCSDDLQPPDVPPPPPPKSPSMLPATLAPSKQRPSSIRSISSVSTVDRSTSIRTIRNMIHQTTLSRRATMLSVSVTAPTSDEETEEEDARPAARATAVRRDTTQSHPQPPRETTSSEELALGSFLKLIERRGITQPQIEALRQHLPSASTGLKSNANGTSALGRQSLRRAMPYRAHTKRRSKKKKRSKRDKERDKDKDKDWHAGTSAPVSNAGRIASAAGSPLPSSSSSVVSYSGASDSDAGWDGGWEDVNTQGDDMGYLEEIMDVAAWYNLHHEEV